MQHHEQINGSKKLPGEMMRIGQEQSLPDMPREEPASLKLERATVLPAIEAILVESIDADMALVYV